MSNTWKKIANEGFEEMASVTTRSRRHGPKKHLLREKRLRNRAAKRADASLAFQDY